MKLTNRQAGIALFAVAATMKAFDVSAQEARTHKYDDFRRGQIMKHKDIIDVETLMEVELSDLIVWG